MLGLCHICLTSGVPISITKGLIQCKDCNGAPRNNKKEEKEEEKEEILAFEDLPQGDLEHISDFAYQKTEEQYDKEFVRKLAEDRKFDTD